MEISDCIGGVTFPSVFLLKFYLHIGYCHDVCNVAHNPPSQVVTNKHELECLFVLHTRW